MSVAKVTRVSPRNGQGTPPAHQWFHSEADQSGNTCVLLDPEAGRICLTPSHAQPRETGV